MEKERKDEDVDDLAKVLDELRAFVVGRLQSGERPSELCFALAFIAGELGLKVTEGKEPLKVFETVLGALAAATGTAHEGGINAQPSTAEERVPPGAVLH